MHERMETIYPMASYPVTALRTASCGLYFCTISTNWSKSSYISALDMVVWAGRERENDNARIKSHVCFMAAALKLYKLIFITTLLQPEVLCGEGANAFFCRIWKEMEGAVTYFDKSLLSSMFSKILICCIAILFNFINRSDCCMPSLINTAFRFSKFERHIS